MISINETASLSWYDHPASSQAIDEFWRVLRDELRGNGLAAPDTLDRTTPIETQWRNPNLLVAQCCSLDLFTPAGRSLIPIARPVFADLDCVPGSYFSYIIGNAGNGTRIAINSHSSWSGYGALSRWMRAQGSACDSIMETGSHERSVGLVREGRADLAAIDAHAWPLINTTGVSIIDRTDAAPAPPYVTRLTETPDRAALVAGLRTAVAQRGSGIGITDVIESNLDDYRSLATAARASVAPLQRRRQLVIR